MRRLALDLSQAPYIHFVLIWRPFGILILAPGSQLHTPDGPSLNFLRGDLHSSASASSLLDSLITILRFGSATTDHERRVAYKDEAGGLYVGSIDYPKGTCRADKPYI